MKRYEVIIKGINPCLMNRMDFEFVEEIKQIPRAKFNEWENENWKRKAYWDANGKDIKIPDMMIHTMLMTGCKKYKVSPPKSIGRTWTDYVRSSLMAESNVFYYESVVPFGTMVNKNPGGAKRAMVYSVRPKFNDWGIKIIVVDLQDFLSEKILEALFESAGRFVGFGDWRPVWGRFEVKSVKVL